MPSPRPQNLLASGLALFAAAALGCVTHHHHRPAPVTVVHEPTPRKVVVHKGPPPHAPAHGYRHKHGGADLVFDKELGVYIVLGHKETYCDGHRFYRRRGKVWQVTATLGRGVWVSVSSADVPHRLRLHYRHKARKKGRREHHPAAHD
jgi:hypothetical protein